MENSYVLSYDVGTGSVKTVIVDFDGNVVSVANANYHLLTPQAGWAEQEPDSYWEAICVSTKQALQQAKISAEDIKGIAFGTQWKGIIPLDSADHVLHNNIIWLDSRAGKQAEKLNQAMKMNLFAGNDYWPKLMWVKDELPEVYQKTVCFLEVNAYLKFKATGMKAVDVTNNFIHTTDTNLQVFFDQILAAADLDHKKFPPLVMTTEKVGVVTAKAADEMGLLAGIPVFGGCGDIPAITIGSGCCEDDDAHIYLGSSGWMGTITKRGTTIDDFYLTFEKDKDIRLEGLKSAGMSFNWAIDQFYHAEKDILKGGIFDFVNNDIQAVPAGSLNMIATPWIYGAFPPVAPTARSIFFNITNLHDRRHMVNAILEGICYQMCWALENYNKKIGKNIKSIRVVGGCASSDHWMQIMSDILQIPVEVPENPSHAGAIGSAYCAFIGLGTVAGFKEVKSKIKVAKIFLPRKENAPIYAPLFEIFKQLSPTMETLFNSINH